MTSLVSILIPCHNAAPWLAQTLESALAQTWPHREIIVVDDGSTDNSAEIARTFASRGVRLVAQPNRGQCAACNHGLRLARGDFIKFFDADDLISSNMIERQVAALAGKPGHLAYSEWARFHTDPAEAVFTPRPGWHDAAPVDWLVETWYDAEPMMQSGQFLIPHAILDRTGGWDEQLSLINDFEFFTRVVLASRGIVFTPAAKLYYRSGQSGSLSSLKGAKAWNSAFLSLTKGTDCLLNSENSPRTRPVCATILQGLVYEMYPNMPWLVAQLEARVSQLGGTSYRPQGGRSFRLASRILGWKAARWLQVCSGKIPRPVREHMIGPSITTHAN